MPGGLCWAESLREIVEWNIVDERGPFGRARFL